MHFGDRSPEVAMKQVVRLPARSPWKLPPGVLSIAIFVFALWLLTTAAIVGSAGSLKPEKAAHTETGISLVQSDAVSSNST